MKQDRVLVRDGRRHHRRRYSLAEVRIGLVILLVLAAVAAWVAWKGANPDPELLGSAPELLTAAAPEARTGSQGERGPLPPALAPPGFREGRLSDFDPENLYVKINGRADYYKSSGFRHLWVLTLESEVSPGPSVDIELYDQGEALGALGAYQGERSPTATSSVGEGGLHHFDRNALFLTRGRYYVRAIASEESAAVHAALVELHARLQAGLPGEPLPWTWALFVGALGLEPGSLAFMAENAFSFGFARNVHTARLTGSDVELFVVLAADAGAASRLARDFEKGFREYGKDAGSEAGVQWSEDRYLGAVSGAAAAGGVVLGVRGAPDRAAAVAALARLRAALAEVAVPAGPSAAVPSPPGAEPGYPESPEPGP